MNRCVRRLSRLFALCGLVASLGLGLDGCGGGGSSGSATATPVVTTPSLSVAVTGGGSVRAGSLAACRSSCTNELPGGTQLALAATADAGFRFAGWTGACQGLAGCTLTVTGPTSVGALFTALPPVAAAPKALYTDVVSGPTSGGEAGKGAYLSIFGANFGSSAGLGTTTRVFIGNAEVANYRFLGNSAVMGKLGLQQLTVQVGSLGAAAAGQALPIKVVVNDVDSNTDLRFTPSLGKVLFVSLNGNDSTAQVNDISRPWRTLQNGSELSGVLAAAGPGDQIVIRGGNWSDISGIDNTWVRFLTLKGSPPTGAAGTGWIHFTAYPGPIQGNAIEDVHYSTPAGVPGGIAGPPSGRAGQGGEYIAVSNLRIDVNARANSDAAPINLQYTGGHWRIVNNELGPWPSSLTLAVDRTNARAAGVSGHGDDVTVLGNHIHDIGCDPAALENHGIYADTTAMNWEVAYNWVHDITGGSLVQFFDNEGGTGSKILPNGTVWQGFTGIRVHHNWLENAAKYGLNIGDPGAFLGVAEMRAWNNVIIGTFQPPIRTASTAPQIDITYAYNTIYDSSIGGERGYFFNAERGNAPRIIRVFNNLMAFGPRTPAGNSWFVDNSINSTGWTFQNNLYWDNGVGKPAFTLDATRVVGDPRFVDAGARQLSLAAGSPAIDRAASIVPFPITDDFTALLVRPQGAANDIGAFERLP